MQHYQFNIGDYASHTKYLTPMQDLAYRRLLDLYYLQEKPISADNPAVLIGMDQFQSDVEQVLKTYFVLTKQGWTNKRVEQEIQSFKKDKKNKSHMQTSVADQLFDEFWSEYPKKVGKEAARKAWQKHNPDLKTVKDALSWQRVSDQWLKDGGQFIPNPSTYLNQNRWLDEKPLPTPIVKTETAWERQNREWYENATGKKTSEIFDMEFPTLLRIAK